MTFSTAEKTETAQKKQDNFEKEEEIDLNALLDEMKKTDEETAQVQGEFVALLKNLTSSDEAVMSSLNDLIGLIEGDCCE